MMSGALKIIPEVKLEGELGGSVVIECPLPEMYARVYLCREIPGSAVCATVVSNKNFFRKEYKRRVTLELFPERHLFLVEVTELTKSDSGVYACGVGMHTDEGKTQLVTLKVYSEYEPFWEEEPMPEHPKWYKHLHLKMPPLFQMPTHGSSSKFVSKATTPMQRTAIHSAHHPSSTTPVTHHPRVSRASSEVAAEFPTLPPSTTALKTSAHEEQIRPQTASYNHHTRLHRQRAFNYASQPGRENQGFHILIPTTLGLILLVLLGLVVKRAIQRRKGPQETSLSAPGASAIPAPLQLPEAPWLHAPSVKTSCEYVSLYHQPAAKMEGTDSDYINIACLTHLPSSPPGPRPWCQ
ncbi:Fas apoptotic inhibitory molecule 3 [Tupaia chinensis]|uniref:Fas apoptotic inhibitory molecule 3 n=1 Tax=Tupaia chinensis TaxID=246437 RepID=L9JAZ4_TUPCH|nr:Fas apoptotic inhibitory molecule 3 [Tupaia chinensis]